MTTSIAMAVYNGEKYIEKQLDSIRLQTHPVDEVVIVDDCSTDDTLSYVKSYITKHNLNDCWKIYSNDTNCGFIKTFYKALQKTTGDLVFLCDQDDVWHEDKVELMSNQFENNANIRLLACTFDGIDDTGNSIAVRSPIFTENHGMILFKKYKIGRIYQIPFKTICDRNISMGCTMVAKRDLVNFYLEKSSSEIPHDWELAFGAAIKDGLYFYNKPLIDYRIHDDNTIGIKADDADITTDYRREEYEKYIEYQRYFIDNYSKELGNVAKERTLNCVNSFLIARRDNLEDKNRSRAMRMMLSYVLKLGIHALEAIIDIL